MPGVHRQPEAVGAQHRTRMHPHARAQAYPGHQGHAGGKHAAGADFAVIADHAARADHRAGGDPAAGTDADEGADLRVRSHRRIGGDHRAGVDARRRHGHGLEQRRDLREGDVGRLRHQAGNGAMFGVLGRQHDRAGTGAGKLLAVARIGQEGQLRRAGAGEGADAEQAGRTVAAQGQAEPFGQPGQRVGLFLPGQCGRLRTCRRR